ncbi:glycosyltransferase [Pseudobutyrivibrio xylanivorans]|uniref:Glycosyltransferase involved in cell wall bisynthesis n=1 Tax=Pseudobutyrivibrio xylanivorans TaxID=185007 RepID=A0A1G5RZZ1_PSEXY|nr:glycosyltransferase [Pseudobutyrivibrio xylanivorans]SCZ79715.1 Glycosyltransferase involved in cell wall bisynthesis [Pseudobutyrivibrio xylanivorans]
MHKDLITVIVPIYNVEKYIHKCVDSILNQTYSNLEIFLVDDGSPDGCPQICDEYAQKDSRIKVIHKKNGGLSDARNVAIDVMTGKYVTFVDSDDYLSLDCIESMYNALVSNDADLAVCNYAYITEDNQIINHPKCSGKIEVFGQEEALYELLDSRKYSNSAWGKLYRADYFEDVRYPFGKIYEDVPTTYKLFMKADKVAYVEQTNYFYLYNIKAISKQAFKPQRMDAVYFAEDMVKVILKKYPGLKNVSNRRLFDSYCTVLDIITKDNEYYKEVKDKYDSLKWKVLLDVKSGIRRKVKALKY